MRAYREKYLKRPGKQEAYRDYIREYNQRPEVKKRKGEYAKRWATRERRRAYYWTTEAVKHGELEPASAFFCADCGAAAKRYFYVSYDIPPELVPVCLSCHRIRVVARGREE